MRVLVDTLSVDEGEHVFEDWANLIETINRDLIVRENGPCEWTVKANEKMTVVITVYVGE